MKNDSYIDKPKNSADRDRHPAAHRSPPARTDGSGRGHQDKPSPAFDDPNGTDGFSHILRTLPFSCGLTLLLGWLLLIPCAAIALRAPDPVALIAPLAWCAVGLASFLGGILAGRRHPSAPVACALTSGAVIALILFLTGLCFGHSEPSAASWLLRLGVIPCHLMGAYISRPRPRAAAHGDHAPGHHHRR